MAGKIANGVFIGTCIGAFIGTILCALYARVPFAQAPGMGLKMCIRDRGMEAVSCQSCVLVEGRDAIPGRV